MTSTGSSSANASGTSPMHTVFWPTKPIVGSLVQIKSDTYAAGWEEYPTQTGLT